MININFYMFPRRNVIFRHPSSTNDQNLMFFVPCIVIYPYNKNQQDALFTFNLFQ